MSKGLTFDELKAVTGGKTATEVIAILRQNGVKPLVGKGGKPFLLSNEYMPQQNASNQAQQKIEL